MNINDVLKQDTLYFLEVFLNVWNRRSSSDMDLSFSEDMYLRFLSILEGNEIKVYRTKYGVPDVSCDVVDCDLIQQLMSKESDDFIDNIHFPYTNDPRNAVLESVFEYFGGGDEIRSSSLLNCIFLYVYYGKNAFIHITELMFVYGQKPIDFAVVEGRVAVILNEPMGVNKIVKYLEERREDLEKVYIDIDKFGKKRTKPSLIRDSRWVLSKEGKGDSCLTIARKEGFDVEKEDLVKVAINRFKKTIKGGA